MQLEINVERQKGHYRVSLRNSLGAKEELMIHAEAVNERVLTLLMEFHLDERLFHVNINDVPSCFIPHGISLNSSLSQSLSPIYAIEVQGLRVRSIDADSIHLQLSFSKWNRRSF